MERAIDLLARDVWLMLVGVLISIPIAVLISLWFYRKNELDMRAWAERNAREQKDWTYKILIALQNGESLEIPRDEHGEWTGGIGVRVRAAPATIRVSGGMVTATDGTETHETPVTRQSPEN